MKRSARATIDTTALRHNLARCREVAPNSLAMAVIKADAYGHNMLKTAAALSHANGFAVSCLQEAIELRQARFIHPILVLQGFNTLPVVLWRLLIALKQRPYILCFQRERSGAR